MPAFQERKKVFLEKQKKQRKVIMAGGCWRGFVEYLAVNLSCQRVFYEHVTQQLALLYFALENRSTTRLGRKEGNADYAVLSVASLDGNAAAAAVNSTSTRE